MKQKYILELAVFVCGSIVMVFELVGSRIMAPYFGTSIFVWTSLIGVILGSLSLGYYYGGKVADRNPHANNLSLIIFLSAVIIASAALFKDYFLTVLVQSISGIKVSSVIAAIALFAPASILLGMISPYVAKIKLNDLNNSASTVGNLYAISTLGSIFGTFLAGFYLIPYFGTNKLLIIIVGVLLAVSWILPCRISKKLKSIFFLIICLSWILLNRHNQALVENGIVDTDTEYSRILIYDYDDPLKGGRVKLMGINNENHSAMFIDSEELANEYTKYYHLVRFFNPDFESTLMLGGAGYSYPKDFLRTYSDATIDVVEIDPKVTDLAREYFRLKDDPRLSIFHEDARIYLNETERKYDAIFGDAFGSRCSVPYHLTTQEAVQREFDILNDGGVVILNLISSLDGDNSLFLKSEYATYKSIFPQVFLFPVRGPEINKEFQNIILVALKSNRKIDFNSGDPEIVEFLNHLWKGEIDMNKPILTDDYVPVDYYINKLL